MRSLNTLRSKTALLLLLLVLLCVAQFCFAGTPTERYANQERRMLVVVDSMQVKESHSQFFRQLEQRGYSLKFQLPRDQVPLLHYGDYLFEHLVFMAPSAEDFGGDLSPKALAEFVDAGHNVFIVGGSRLPEKLREFANDLGVEFDADGTSVVDHFNYDAEIGADSHTVLVADRFAMQPVFLGSFASAPVPVLFKGLGMALDQDNKLLSPILSGSGTSYSYTPQEPISDEPHVKGFKTVLVAGVQSKKAGRVTLVGSMDALSNAFFDATVTRPSNGKSVASGNRLFATELTRWAFQERGFLRHRNVTHHRQGETETPANYKISEDIEFSVIIEEWVDNKWVPYVADDIQLELIMLDPYVRTRLKHVSDGKYSVAFKVPDVYGVYKFNVDYRRPGYTLLRFADNVIIRPFRINEYERYIPAAYPYYVSVFALMAGFFVVSAAFLYTGEKKKKD